MSFDGANGSNPIGGLIIDASGTLYGTTFGGGASFAGTVFSLSSSGTLTTLATFDGANGADPTVGLIADASGTLYGTTRGGGAFGLGTVFSLDSSGTLTTLASFDGTNGYDPFAGVIADGSGTLYGTTTGGGAFDAGTVFSLSSSGTLTTLASFNGLVENAFPQTGLVADALGTLYGTTGFGVTSGVGTVFSITGSGFVPVPEPASWAMLIAGFGLVGTGLRVRRRKDAAALAAG